MGWIKRSGDPVRPHVCQPPTIMIDDHEIPDGGEGDLWLCPCNNLYEITTFDSDSHKVVSYWHEVSLIQRWWLTRKYNHRRRGHADSKE